MKLSRSTAKKNPHLNGWQAVRVESLNWSEV